MKVKGRVDGDGALTNSDFDDGFAIDRQNLKGWLIDTAEYSGKNVILVTSLGEDCFRGRCVSPAADHHSCSAVQEI